MMKRFVGVVAILVWVMMVSGIAQAAEVVWQIQLPNSLDEGSFGDLGAVAVNEDGLVYVGDSYNGIYVLEADGSLVDQIQVTGVNSVAGLAVAADGTLWIADDNQNQLVQIRPSGEVLNVIGGSGQFGEFAPTDVAIAPNGEIFVSDTQNDAEGNPVGRIQVFDTQGNFQRDFLTDPNQSGIRVYVDLAFGRRGELYMNDFWGGMAWLDSEGNVLDDNLLANSDLAYQAIEAFSVAQDGSLVLASEGTLYRVSPEGEILESFGSQQGEGEFAAGEFYEAQGLAILPNGEVIVADTNYVFSQIVRVRF